MKNFRSCEAKKLTLCPAHGQEQPGSLSCILWQPIMPKPRSQVSNYRQVPKPVKRHSSQEPAISEICPDFIYLYSRLGNILHFEFNLIV